MKNIILIGFRGTGKTTIAKLLGMKLNRKVFSTDIIVEKNTGENISSIVRTNGWKYFRDLESIALKQLIEERNAVIDCGGGIVLREKNRKLLKRNNELIILLEADVDTIEKIISKDKNRIRFAPKKTLREEIENELRRRNKFYYSLADLIFNSSQQTKEEIVEKIFVHF